MVIDDHVEVADHAGQFVACKRRGVDRDLRIVRPVDQLPYLAKLLIAVDEDCFHVYRATTGLASSVAARTGTAANSVPSSNHDFGAGWPHSVWRCGSSSDQRSGSRSGSTVR